MAAEETRQDWEKILASQKRYWVSRRVQDVVLSALALVVLSPVMVLIAILIFLDDPHGSPLFIQERIGYRCQPFRMIKFRTMFKDAEDKLEGLIPLNEKKGKAFKIKNDPRITRMGRFLRSTGLDELPQLINILRGEMSIVGPRPALRREVEQYTDYERQRFMIYPGLTCYWQIQPNRDDIDFADWVEMDLKYIRERNLLVDWKIIFLTVGAVLRASGE